MKLRSVAVGITLFSTMGMAGAQEYDLTPDYVPQERSDFERALETPPPEPYVPNALEALEQGKIPTHENPMPQSDGFGATIKGGGLQGTYTTDF
ncbi:hypothetical protein CN230_31320 [Sinorhizobium meliloti]|uniref:hypothetical protein n=1 Tax=Rhizobium meliloti TaxID=382 RepID=UPI000FDB51C9|nr:hypothetical protein [Sinorhizobium meliloti]RVG01812.1 hypothetical protein CN230_31320 [Sinorhizobium meliloti]